MMEKVLAIKDVLVPSITDIMERVLAAEDVLVFLKQIMEKVSAAGDVRVFPSIDNGKSFGMSLSSLK